MLQVGLLSFSANFLTIDYLFGEKDYSLEVRIKDRSLALSTAKQSAEIGMLVS